MARVFRPRTPLTTVGVGWMIVALGCSVTATAPDQTDSEPAEAIALPPGPSEPAPSEPGPSAAREPAAPLTAEELALLATDPKDLSVELRRKRAYARRKQIMQNPNSTTARALNDLAEAHRAGELKLEKRDGTWLSAPGAKPNTGRPPAGWRPPPSTNPTPTPDSP